MACLSSAYFLTFQSPSDNQDNLLKKLTNYMKEKDRALQVGYQQSGFLPSLVLFFFLIIPFRNHKSASRANVYLKNVDELFQMCVFRRNDPQNTQNRKFFQSIFSHTSCVLMQHGSSFPDLFDCFGCWLVSNR